MRVEEGVGNNQTLDRIFAIFTFNLFNKIHVISYLNYKIDYETRENVSIAFFSNWRIYFLNPLASHMIEERFIWQKKKHYQFFRKIIELFKTKRLFAFDLNLS